MAATVGAQCGPYPLSLGPSPASVEPLLAGLARGRRAR